MGINIKSPVFSKLGLRSKITIEEFGLRIAQIAQKHPHPKFFFFRPTEQNLSRENFFIMPRATMYFLMGEIPLLFSYGEN